MEKIVDVEKAIQELGNVSATPLAAEALATIDADVQILLFRHLNNDYGDVPFDTVFQNDLAKYKKQGVVRSSYLLDGGLCIVVETRFNQPLTTIFLAAEAE